MGKGRFTGQRVIAILREQEAGVLTAKVCWRPAISPVTFYAWKVKFGGVDVGQARKRKVLEEDRAIVAPLVQARWRGPG